MTRTRYRRHIAPRDNRNTRKNTTGKRWSPRPLITLVLGGVISFIIAHLVVSQTGLDQGADLLTGVIAMTLLGIIACVLRVRLVRNTDPLTGDPFTRASDTGAAGRPAPSPRIWIGVVAGLIALAPVGSLLSLISNTETNSEPYKDLPVALIATAVVFSLLLAPFIEEVIFRGVLLPSFATGQTESLLPLISSAVLFGVMHGNLIQAVVGCTLGILLGILYIVTGKLITTVCAHIGFNILVAGLPVPTGLADYINPIIPATVLILITLTCALWISTFNTRDTPTQTEQN